MNLLMTMLPPLIYVLSISSAVHLANYYRDAVEDEVAQGISAHKSHAIKETFVHGATPCGLAAFTTGIGLISLVLSKIEPILKENGARGTYTGVIPLIYKAQRQLLQDLFYSFLSAFAVIGLTLVFVLRSVLAALVAMTPNLFPAVLVLGGLEWVNIPIQIGSVMTANAALAISSCCHRCCQGRWDESSKKTHRTTLTGRTPADLRVKPRQPSSRFFNPLRVSRVLFACKPVRSRRSCLS